MCKVEYTVSKKKMAGSHLLNQLFQTQEIQLEAMNVFRRWDPHRRPHFKRTWTHCLPLTLPPTLAL
jgi:hypothetical protein